MKYRPSNGTEGMMFMEKFCDRCVYNESVCDIQLDTMIFEVDDSAYPEEWIIKDDKPCCTKFKEEA